MIIDFHVHAFPDALAERAVKKLKDTAAVENYTNGTIEDLREKLDEWKIDRGILLPIATKPTQQTKINDWAAGVNSGNITAFGTVHPYAENVAEEIHRIKALGLKGVKLHPDYQGYYLFDEKVHPIFKECEALGLPIIIHMGYDPVSPVVHRAICAYLPEFLAKYPKIKLVCAHLGGSYTFEETLHFVGGLKNVWLDTAFAVNFTTPEETEPMIKKHGIDRILFGSDCPWASPVKTEEFIEKMNLSSAEKDKIYHGNAEELLEM